MHTKSTNSFIAVYSWSQSEILNLGLHCQFEDESTSNFQNLNVEITVLDYGKKYYRLNQRQYGNDVNKHVIFSGRSNIASLVSSGSNVVDAWQPLSIKAQSQSNWGAQFNAKIAFFEKCPSDCSFNIKIKFPLKNFIALRYWTCLFFELSFFGYHQLSFEFLLCII